MTRVVVVDPIRFLPTEVVPIDIFTGFTDNDYISCAFPDFDLANIDINNSYLDITSHPAGNFDSGPTDSVSFQYTLVPFVQGDSEFRFYKYWLKTINQEAVTGVRFRITAIHATTFNVAAIRCISRHWKYAPIDLDTLYQRVVAPVSPTGNPAYALGISEFPIIYRSDHPSGELDPQPIDVDLSTFLYTGSLTQTSRDSDGDQAGYNEFSLYLRESTLLPVNQLTLSGNYTQDQLEGLSQVPDFLPTINIPRTQASLDALQQRDLNFRSQAYLDSDLSSDETAWIKVDLKWDQDGASLDINDYLGNGYNWLDEFDLLPNLYYIMRVVLENTTMRVQVFQSDYLGNVGSVVFDTQKLHDPTTFKRRKGRVGWFASLLDGDAYVKNLRSWGLNFAEYRSEIFQSNTPVEGAQIQIGGALSRDLYNGIESGPWGGVISLDQSKSVSGNAIKINNISATPLAGIITNKLYFDDWNETTLFFNLFFPSTSQTSLPEVFLLGEYNRIIPLILPNFSYDKWTSLKIALGPAAFGYQPGYYQIAWVQPTGGVPTTWWIDQIHVMARMNKWMAKATNDDPWGLAPPTLVPFKDTINVDNDGIVFERGTALQVSAQARRQDSRISSIKVKPKYATLGNIVWADQKLTPVVPTPSFTYTTVGLTVSFTDTSTDAGTPPGIIFRQWDFGDQAIDTGPTPVHTFAAHGTYTVALQVINRQGQRNIVSNIITV